MNTMREAGGSDRPQWFGNSSRWIRIVLVGAAVVAGLAACGSAGSPSAGSSAGTSGGPAAAPAGGLMTARIGSATVLANAKGFTLYSFAPDTSGMSNCNGTCAQNWPPVKGRVSAVGVKGTFATIQRADGSTQTTFNGHPLYTFVGDTGPGQDKGNGLNAAGGLWQVVTTSGSAGPAAVSSSTSSSGGGGLGY
jgi:predicted lipoprotein with Yx(FWY)xxD motif